ncbi:hypothetical protein BD289DRAFT_273100 [Coniella lustricola]|uniref:Uncharacterized protein n=1 Tax=Coniella lustricola TaxID=2025994 RepID=A0A2T3AKK3_9PEZI|nr:hypothetical protein BD289DRAFT_273100 [Coniella lustricola]
MRAARDRVHNENGPGRLDPQQGRSVRAPILRGQKHLPPAPPQLGAGIVRGPGPGPGPGAVHSRRCNAVNPLPLNIQRMAALEQAQMPMPSQMGPFQHAGMIPFNMGGVQPQHLYQQQFNNNGGGVAAAGQYVNAIPGLWAPTAADLDALRRELLTQPGAAPPSAHPPHGPAQPAAMPGGLPQRQQQYQPRQDPVIQQQVGDFIHRANLPIGQLATLPDAPGQGNSDLGNQRDPWATALPDLKRFDMDVDVWKEMFGPDF